MDHNYTFLLDLRNSVRCRLNRKSIITIQIWFNLASLEIKFCVLDIQLYRYIYIYITYIHVFRCTAIRETGVFRHHGWAPLKPLGTSRQYDTEGFEGGRQLNPCQEASNLTVKSTLRFTFCHLFKVTENIPKKNCT